MTRKLLIVLVNTDPRNPEELGAPFYHAAVAAAMDYEVDVICAATAGKLMRRGVAQAIREVHLRDLCADVARDGPNVDVLVAD